MRQPAPVALFSALSAGLLLGGCAPALDWRELRPGDGDGIVVLMPCRALPQQRQVALDGRPVRLVLHACDAAGRTWALALADVRDPALVPGALGALRAAAAANIRAGAAQALPLAIPGATPQPGGGRERLAGRRPDGSAVEMELAAFARGTRVFQATVLGESLARDDAETFFASMRFTP